MTLPRLLVLTDRAQLPPGRDLVTVIGECVHAGLTHVVLRELDLSADDRAVLAAQLADAGATVIAAHEPLPGGVGVHLPADSPGLDTPPSGLDTPPSQARAATRPADSLGWSSSPSRGTSDGRIAAQRPGSVSDRRLTSLLGRSCHSADEVEAAAAEGADYATLSPYAATESKPGYGPPLPPDAYAGHPIPVLALGGITPDNAAKAVAAGAHGVAVMGAVMRAGDPADVVRSLLTEVSA